SVALNNVFFKRARNNENWTLFDPNKVQILLDKFGQEFEDAYIRCENDESLTPYKHVVSARSLFEQIALSQLDSGMPFLKNIDAVNMKSNQQNLGFIRCSNLCQEIDLFTGPNDIGVCILGNLVLN